MPGMDEASIFEALGVAQQSEGGNEQGAAAPAGQGQATQTEESGRAQEADASASGSGSTPAEGATGQTGAGSTEGAEPAPDSQSEAERRENAARRRREEQQQAINDAIAQERERSKGEWAAFFAEAKLKNTLTGQPITSLEEFNSWKAAYNAKQLEKDLKAGKLTPEGLEKAISDNPTVKKMRESMDRQAEAAKQSDMAAAKARIDAEVKEIHEMDPTINTTADLLKMPNAKEFYEFVRKGLSFKDAFYLANRERLEARTAEAAKQQAMSAARSKDHLNATGNARGAGAIGVPADEMALFKLFNPGASEAEIQAYYNKTRKE